MNKLFMLLAVVGLSFLTSCYHAHVCPTYTQQEVEQTVNEEADNL